MAASASSWKEWRALLANRRFLLFEASATAGSVGYAVYTVAMPWLTYHLTHSLADVGLVLAAEFGIYAFAFVAGPFVDRARNQRTIIVAGYLLQGLLTGILALLLLRGGLGFPLLLGLVAALSFVWDFTWASSNVVVPLILDKDDLFRAEGFGSLLGSGNQVAGFTAGGALILLTGPGGAILLYAFLNVAGALLMLPVSVPGAGAPGTSLAADFWEGWRHLVRSSDVPRLSLAGYMALQGVLSSASLLFITALAAARYPTSASESYGILYTGFVLGGTAIGIALGHWSPRRRVGWLMVLSPLVSAGLFLAVLLAPSTLWVALPLCFALGAAMLSFETLWFVFVQATSPKDRLGRTLGNLYVFRGSARAAGAVALGALAVAVSLMVFGTTVALGLALVGLVGLAALPSVRTLAY